MLLQLGTGICIVTADTGSSSLTCSRRRVNCGTDNKSFKQDVLTVLNKTVAVCATVHGGPDLVVSPELSCTQTAGEDAETDARHDEKIET